MTRIISAVSYLPEYIYSKSEIIDHFDRLWFTKIDSLNRRKAIKIFENSGIEHRASVIPLTEVLADKSFEEKNNLYKLHVKKLAKKVLEKALVKAQLNAQAIDLIITTSCTGFMIPSVDAYLVNELKLKQNVLRLPVTEMGCAGGTSGLIYAHEFLKNNPDKVIALVCVETPGLTLQKQDVSLENFVSSAIFADGAAAVILDGKEKNGATIIDTQMYHFPDCEHLMGFNLQNTGLKIILDKAVPETIASHFPKFFHPFMEKNKIKPQDIAHYLFHPGGKKIIDFVEKFIGEYGKQISLSKNTLRDHGNMSSATILYILEKLMDTDIKKSDFAYMLAFGPGFSAQSLMLQWK